jgi:hypothetical protein
MDDNERQRMTTESEHLARLHRVMTNVLANPEAPPEMVALAEAYLTAYPSVLRTH